MTTDERAALWTPAERLTDAIGHAQQIVNRHGHEVAIALIRRNIEIANRDWSRAYWRAALAAIEVQS